MRFRFFCFLLLFFVGAARAQPTAFAPDERAWYGLINRGSGRCLDITGAAVSAGAAAVQWEFTHAASQQWHFVPLRAGAEYYRIEARHSGQCLTAERNATGTATVLVQRPFQGSEAQQWRLLTAGPAGSLQIECKADAQCLGLAAADKFNGTPVLAQRVAGRASQQWRLFKLRLNVNADVPAFGPAVPVPALASAGNELAPVLAPDGGTLYFQRTKFAGNTEGNTDTGDPWLSRSPDHGRTWGPPERLDALATPQNNAVLAVTGPPDGTSLVVRGSYEAGGVFRDEGLSRVPRAAASAAGATAKNLRPTLLRVANYYSATPATGFFVTSDEKLLISSLERGDSEGGNDLYYSRADGSGGYTEPQSLGPILNSPGFDFAPWLAPDGRTLYFASYGHMGYGLADIFVSTRLDANSWSKWSEPRNLGPSVNGPGFQAYLTFSPDGKTAYYASGATAKSSYDILQAAPPAPDSVARPAAPAVISEANRAFVSGRILDARTRQPVPGATVKATLLANAEGVQFEATGRADATGTYTLSVLAGRYKFAGAGGFLTSLDTLTFSGNVGRDLLLRPAAVGAKLDLVSIIFAQGKAGLLPGSYAELNRLAIALQADVAIEIRLEGHTDNVGPPEKNQQLSEDRVAEVKRYLVGRGVAENRLSTIGFGGSKPRYGNEREETRKLNRRVEMVIVK